MTKVYAFISNGMEEVECLAVCDILLRAGYDVKLVSIAGNKTVRGAHGFKIEADMSFEEVKEEADLLFLPGGMPGTTHLREHEGLRELLLSHHKEGKRIAAICAAPSVLGSLGIAEGRRVTCFPGFEGEMKGSIVTEDPMEVVITDGNITTARGMGAAFDLGLELVRLYSGEETARTMKSDIQYVR